MEISKDIHRFIQKYLLLNSEDTDEILHNRSREELFSFRRPKTTYRYPPIQSRADLMLLYCKYTHFIRKFYAPNNHIKHTNFHS